MSLKSVRFSQIVLLIGLLIIWQIVAQSTSSLFFASPIEVIVAFLGLFTSGEVMDVAAESLISLVIGFLLAVVISAIIGYIMGWYAGIGKILDPFVSAFYVIPVISIVPLIILFLGTGFVSRVIAITIFCVFEMIINIYGGVKNVNAIYIDVGKVFGANKWQIFQEIVIHDSLPILFSAIRIGANRAIQGMITSEMIFAATGIGGLLIVSQSYYQADKLLATVLLIVILGVITNMLVQLMERFSSPWRVK
jgi:ABC-type nitrate/sulfonate/bicarbonate transport system permease component